MLSEYAYHAAAEAAEAEAEADAAEAAALTEGTTRRGARDARAAVPPTGAPSLTRRRRRRRWCARGGGGDQLQSAMRGRATRSAMAKWRRRPTLSSKHNSSRRTSPSSRAEALLKRVVARARAVALQSAERGRRVRSPKKGMETDLSACRDDPGGVRARVGGDGRAGGGAVGDASRASIDQTRFEADGRPRGDGADRAAVDGVGAAAVGVAPPPRCSCAAAGGALRRDGRGGRAPRAAPRAAEPRATTPRLAFAHPEGLGYGAFLAEVNQIMRDEARSSAVMEELTAEYIRLSVRASVTSARGSMASAAEEADEETLAEQETAATAAAVAQAEALVRQASDRVPRLSAEMGASQDEMPRGGTEPSGFNLALPAAGTAVRRGSDTTAPSGVVFTEDDELVGGGSLPPFLPSEAFTGGRAGYLFKRGPSASATIGTPPCSPAAFTTPRARGCSSTNSASEPKRPQGAVARAVESRNAAEHGPLDAQQRLRHAALAVLAALDVLGPILRLMRTRAVGAGGDDAAAVGARAPPPPAGGAADGRRLPRGREGEGLQSVLAHLPRAALAALPALRRGGRAPRGRRLGQVPRVHAALPLGRGRALREGGHPRAAPPRVQVAVAREAAPPRRTGAPRIGAARQLGRRRRRRGRRRRGRRPRRQVAARLGARGGATLPGQRPAAAVLEVGGSSCSCGARRRRCRARRAPRPHLRANKEARVAEIEHESLEWLGIAEPSQGRRTPSSSTPASTTARRCATPAPTARRAAPPRCTAR